MVLPFNDRYIRYDPVVLTTEFLVDFPVFNDDDLSVFVASEESSDFTVDSTYTFGVSTSTKIILNSAVSGVSVEIYGSRQPARGSNFFGNSPLFPGNIQRDMDALTAVQQEMYREHEEILLQQEDMQALINGLTADVFYRTRQEIIDDLGFRLKNYPEGREVRIPGRSWVKMLPDHPFYGTDPISDMPKFAPAGPIEGDHFANEDEFRAYSEVFQATDQVIHSPGYLRHRVVALLDGNPSSDNFDRLYGAVDDLEALGGGELIIPAGEHGIDPTGRDALVLLKRHVIQFQSGAKLIGAAGMTGSVLRIQGNASNSDPAGPGQVTLVEPWIDISAADILAANGNPTCFSPGSLDKVMIFDPFFYGGEFYSAAVSTGGDTAVSPVNVNRLEWRGGIARGFMDAGCYSGGGNDLTGEDDGVSTLVLGALFEHCFQGVVVKRDGYHHKVSESTMNDCGYGVATADVGAGQEQLTAYLIEVHNNFINRARTAGILFRGQTVGRAIGNRIRDWGYEEKGVSSAPYLTNRGGVLLQGAVDCDVSQNRFEMVELAATDQVGIRIDSHTTQDGVFHAGGRAKGSGNYFQNVPEWTRESNSGVAASIFTGNQTRGSGSIVQMQSGSIFERGAENTPAGRRIHKRVDSGLGSPMVLDGELTQWDTLTGDASLNFTGHRRGYRFTGTDTTVTVTLPAAVQGLEVSIANSKTAGTLRVTAATGDKILAEGGEVLAGSYVSTSETGATVVFRAITADDWVASQTGAWWDDTGALSEEYTFSYTDRPSFIADLSTRLATYPAGRTVLVGEDGYLRMPVGHALYGADPISDAPGWAPSGIGNQRHFGAVGDGVTDDTSALLELAAYYNAMGGLVRLTAGDYVCTAVLALARSGGKFRGDGATATIIRGGGGIDYATELDFELSGITVVSSAGDGIVIGETAGSKTNASWFTAFDLKTNFAGGRGIAFGDVFMADIYALRAQNSTGIGIDLSSGFKTSLNIRDCHATDGATDGWKIKNAVYSEFSALGADRNDGYGYALENLHNCKWHGGAEDSGKAMFSFHYNAATADLTKGFKGLIITAFEKDNNALAGATGQFAHFTASAGAAVAGTIEFDGCSHYNTPSGNALQIDSGNYKIVMPRSRNQIKRDTSGGSFSVIADGAGDVPNGISVNVTGANTPIATLRPKLTNGVGAYGGKLTVYATNNNLGSAARSATYELILTKAIGTSGITQIAAVGNVAGSTADSASFTFSLDTANNHLEVTPIGSTAAGNWYFHITAHGNLDVEPL